MVEDPGTRWRYKSGDTQVLAMIIEKATGKTVSEYASEKLWKPMGMKYDALWNLDDEGGLEKAYCCLYTNARDLARFGTLWLDSGRIISQQVIPIDFLKQAWTPVNLPDDEGKVVDNYGYQWWMMDYNGVQVKYCRGILGQYIILFPELDAVAVRLGHKRSDVKINGHPSEVMTYIDESLKLLEK